MDLYEYLLNKLNVILEFIPKFNTYSLYIKSETGKKIISNPIPIYWTPEEIFKYYRNLDPNSLSRQINKDLDFFCRQLNVFPDDLESIEYVDLLLTLNGMNKGS